MYDSTEDTIQHILDVNKFLHDVIERLVERGANHDKSKLEIPEKELFDKYTPLLKDVSYGSEKYKQYLKEMGVALDHHYTYNSHHPEHWPVGIEGMSLLDIVEMICDWKAALLRHNDGNIWKSLQINRERFKISDELYHILRNTIADIGW